MASKQANSKQKEWMIAIADFASTDLNLLYGDEFDRVQFQLHHVLGRSAKNNKTAIGHEFILPVPFFLHDVNSNHPENVTHNKKAFVRRFGTQRDLFNTMNQSMKEEGYIVPDIYVYDAIMSSSA